MTTKKTHLPSAADPQQHPAAAPQCHPDAGPASPHPGPAVAAPAVAAANTKHHENRSKNHPRSPTRIKPNQSSQTRIAKSFLPKVKSI